MRMRKDDAPITADAPLLGILTEKTSSERAKRLLFKAVRGKSSKARLGAVQDIQRHTGAFVSVNSEHVGARLTISNTIAWDHGRIELKGVNLPQQIRLAMRGLPVTNIVQHRHLSNRIAVAQVDATGSGLTVHAQNHRVRIEKPVHEGPLWKRIADWAVGA